MFLPTAVLIVPRAVRVVSIFLPFQSSNLLFINLSNSYSFAFNAPTVWNALPDEVCASPSLLYVFYATKTSRSAIKIPF